MKSVNVLKQKKSDFYLCFDNLYVIPNFQTHTRFDMPAYYRNVLNL